MALTVTARGTGTHNASSTTFTLSPSGSLAAGSMAVLVVAADNAAASGVAFTTFSVSDDQANVWVRRVTPLYDPGAASEGVTGAQFTTDMASGTLTSASVITVTFDTATTAKAWALWEVIPAALKVVSYIASGVNTGAATTTPTVTTSSITSGDVVIGGLHNEYGTAQTITQDGDSTNGAWSSQQTNEIGTTTAGMSVSSQSKVTTGTATQTYNPTLGTSSDVILSWIQLREIPFLQVGAVDQTSFALLDSLSLRFNTFDFALKDPATVPAIGDAVTLGLPTWAGIVTSVETRDLRIDYQLVSITATNADEGLASAGPFGLSDAPNGTTTFGFQNMAVRTSDNLDASVETNGSCTIFRAGLWPAMTFTITSANRGYSAQSFSVRDVTVTWPIRTSPVYRLEFGDPIVTMSVWVASQTALPGPGTITQTMITDGAVTTPKLAANSVTADKLTVGAKSDANAILNPSFEDGAVGWTSGWQTTGAGYSVAATTAVAKTGSLGFQLSTATVSDGSSIASKSFPVAVGDVWYGSCWAESGVGGTSNGFYFRFAFGTTEDFLVADQVDATDLFANAALTNTMVQKQGYVTVPASVTWCRVVLYNYGMTGSVRDLYFDEVIAYRLVGGVKNSSAEVLIDASGITVTEGAITVTNAGATVIIDGTSDMFKIIYSATMSLVAATGVYTTTSTTLSGLGTFASVPGHASFMGQGNVVTSARVASNYFITGGVGYVAGSSGGSPTNPAFTPTLVGRFFTKLDGSNQCVVTLENDNANQASTTIYCTYYILAETSL